MRERWAKNSGDGRRRVGGWWVWLRQDGFAVADGGRGCDGLLVTIADGYPCGIYESNGLVAPA